MSYTPLWIALLLAVLDWLALASNWTNARYFTRPSVILVLIAWLLSEAGMGFPVYLFLLGLAFSLAGDFFLLLPGNRLLPGLVAFLLAFSCYTFGFNYRNFPVNLATPAVIALVALPATQLYRRITTALRASGKARLVVPALVYFLITSFMVISAVLTLVQPEWRWLTIPSWLVASGAILILVSGSLLARNRFVAPLAQGDLPVIVAYHLGQILITTGVIFNFTVLASQ